MANCIKSYLTIVIIIINTNIYAQSVIQPFDPQANKTNQVQQFLQLSDSLYNYDIKQAMLFARQAYEIAKNINNTKLIALCELQIGICYDYLGVNTDALEHLKNAYTIFKQTNDLQNLSFTLTKIGNLYWYLNEFDLALDFYLDAIKIAEQLQDTSLIIGGLISRGAVYGNISMMDSALVFFEQAHELSKKSGDKYSEILSLFNIGDVYLFSEKPYEALKIFHILENKYNFERYATKHLTGKYNSITKAYIEIGNLELARAYNKKAWNALNKYTRLTEKRSYYLLQFQIDTAEKKYKSAINNYIAYKEINDSLINSNFKERLANFETLYDLEKKESEISELTLDNQLKELTIKQNRLINVGATILIVLLAIIVFQVIRTTRKTKLKNDRLQEQKEEIESTLEKLKLTQSQLVQSEKMASLGTLVSGIAHEINNPLNQILGGVELIKSEWKPNKTNTELEACDMVSNAATNLHDIIKALMTFANKGNNIKIELNINAITEATLLFMKNQVPDNVRFEKAYKLQKQLSVKVDEIHQVFMNIFANAFYELKFVDLNKRLIRIETNQENNYAIVRIYNSGKQIPEQHLSSIFDPFFTTKDPGIGTGLGLSIAYSIIHEHLGEITAQNIDEGVRFTIKLPI